MEVTKTLLTCSLADSLPQIIVVKGIMDEWARETGFFEKLRYNPETEYKKGMKEEQKAAIRRKMFAEHLDAAATSALRDHAALTVKLLCSLCFIPEEDADKYSLADMLRPLRDLWNDEGMRDFFMSFARGR